MEEHLNNEPNIEPVVDNPYREYLFNIVIEEMPGLRHLIQGRQDANNIIYDAIDEIVRANRDDVDDRNPDLIMRDAPRVTELERIYNNIRRLLGQQQQAPQQLEDQAPQQLEDQGPQQLEDQGVSIVPTRNNTYRPSSGSRLSGSHPSDGYFGGKLRKTSKKRPTHRIRRRSSKARKSRSTRRR